MLSKLSIHYSLFPSSSLRSSLQLQRCLAEIDLWWCPISRRQGPAGWTCWGRVPSSLDSDWELVPKQSLGWVYPQLSMYYELPCLHLCCSVTKNEFLALQQSKLQVTAANCVLLPFWNASGCCGEFLSTLCAMLLQAGCAAGNGCVHETSFWAISQNQPAQDAPQEICVWTSIARIVQCDVRQLGKVAYGYVCCQALGSSGKFPEGSYNQLFIYSKSWAVAALLQLLGIICSYCLVHCLFNRLSQDYSTNR